MVVFQTKAHLYHNLKKPKAEVLRYQQGLEIVLHARKMCGILAELPRIPVQSVQGEGLRLACLTSPCDFDMKAMGQKLKKQFLRPNFGGFLETQTTY